MIHHQETQGTTQQPASKTTTDETKERIIKPINNNHNESFPFNEPHYNPEEELYHDKMEYDDVITENIDTSQHYQYQQEQPAEQLQNQSPNKNRDINHQQLHHHDQQQHHHANKDSQPPTHGKFRTQQPPFIVSNTKINVLSGTLLKI